MDRNQIQQAILFSERLREIYGWVSKAEELLSAANILESEIVKMWAEVKMENGRVIQTSGRPNVQAQYFMLTAYAIENYFKALLIHRNRAVLRNRLLSSLPRYLNEHDLVKLAQRVNQKLSLPEQDLLIRLSRSSVWAARYPVPTGPSRDRAMEQFSDGRVYFTAYFAPGDIDRLRDFLDRLRSIVKEELEDNA